MWVVQNYRVFHGIMNMGIVKKINNSKNCVFNKELCTCKISSYYKKECIGKQECDEFELRSKNLKITKSVKLEKSVNNKVKGKKKKTPKTVCLGNIIVVSSISTGEDIELVITDIKNPFYGKIEGFAVSLKDDKYIIKKIK